MTSPDPRPTTPPAPDDAPGPPSPPAHPDASFAATTRWESEGGHLHR